MEETILYFALKYTGDFDKIYHALECKEKIDLDLKEKLFNELQSKYTTIVSDDYPNALKEISCPPFVLFYYGNLDLVKGKCIGVIGMRQASEYGIYATETLVKQLCKKNYTIISGMALGIDTVAHRMTIASKGRTIAILGSGIDYCYPKRNLDIYDEIKNNHLIISEYPGKTVPQKINFPRRNRIISGLSDSILVTEANLKSGTMITVGHALEQGKDVYCIPGRIYDASGCNYLITQGAKLVMDVKDIEEE